uniref:WAP domain-containing protein n=1 Tax=Arion vulgaris TaxID=1028688 RepID=A0A0B7A2I8_9EUPU
MYTQTILLLALSVGATLAQYSEEDSLCVQEGCPSNTTCRVVTECPTPLSCTLRALCMESPPRWSHTGVCYIGQPILTMRNGSWEDTQCGPGSPCPNSTYCNIELMDTYATCCRSDPTNVVKPGQCPVSTDSDTSYCSDSCNNDGDCRHNSKCCQTGCRRQCLHPAVENTCQTKTCPEDTYCLTPDMSPCTGTGQCYNVGDCIPCGPLCRMECHHGFETDSRGCPICECKHPCKNILSVIHGECWKH